MSKYICFVMSPIGEKGTQIRQDADDLLDLIIVPALEIYDFKVIRGDHRSEATQINVDVIQSVQEADLCIADLTGLNPNVMYEIGRRDETGKPMIILKKSGQSLPVDLGTRRCIDYDLDSRRGVRDAIQQIRNFLDPIVQRGFEGTSAGASLSEIAAILLRVERKLDRSLSNAETSMVPKSVGQQGELPKGLSAVQTFNLGLRQENIQLLETAMEHLSKRMDKMDFLDKCVGQAAAIGSLKAGKMLIDCVSEFMDSSKSFHDKVDYFASLVSFALRVDREQDVRELADRLENELLTMADGETDRDAANIEIARIHNQINRLYYGLYLETKDDTFLEKAITALKTAIHYNDREPAFYFNLALCVKKIDLQFARENIDKCLDLSKDDMDEDHLSLAYRIYHAMGDPEETTLLERIRDVSPVLAIYLEKDPSL